MHLSDKRGNLRQTLFCRKGEAKLMRPKYLRMEREKVEMDREFMAKYTG